MTDAAAQPLKPGSVKTFTCPSCGGTISIRAMGITITAICQSCGSIIDVANDNLDIIRKAAVKIRKSTIPIGSRGTLFGVLWEVIGYTELSDGTGNYEWHEYLLFNPYQGFRFLVEADGHWNFVKMLREHIPGAGTADELWVHGRKYHIYERGEAIVQYVMGEFYWRVKVKDKSHVADYICPPYMLSMEESAGDVIWSLGIYIDRNDVRHAFIPDSAIPTAKGIAPNQLSPHAQKVKSLSMPLLLFFLGLILLQYIAVSTAGNQVLYSKSMHVEAAYKDQPVLADPIAIPDKSGNLEILSYSPVSNNWVELNISLVNDTTQESDDFTQSIEYYSGWDSDGNWSEGGQTVSNILSAVPGGKYRLLVEPDAGAFTSYQPIDFTVKVVRNVPVWSNFWIALLLLLIYPLYLVIRKWSFETQRWSNSDYAPGVYKKGQS